MLSRDLSMVLCSEVIFASLDEMSILLTDQASYHIPCHPSSVCTHTGSDWRRHELESYHHQCNIQYHRLGHDASAV